MRLAVWIFGLLMVTLLSSCSNNKENSETNTAEALEGVDSTLLKLNSAIARNPKEPEVYYNRALYWQEQDDIKQALADLKSALLLDTLNGNYFYTLGELYFKMGALVEADDAMGVAYKRNPQLVKAYIKRGEFAFYQKYYDQAMQYINAGLKIDVNNADGYFWKGMVYLEQKNEAKALSNFLTATEQNPDHHEAYMQIGLIYLAKSDKKAWEYFTNALRTDPKSKEALYARGMYLQGQGFADSARKDYRALLNIDSNYATALFNMGYLDMLEEKFQPAILWFTKAVEANPQYYNALYNRGLCYELSGDKQAAARDFRRALTIEPGFELAISALKRLK